MNAARKEEDAVSTDDPWVSLNMAASLRGRARTTVLLEALEEKIRYQRIAGRIVFHRDDLGRLKASEPSRRIKRNA